MSSGHLIHRVSVLGCGLIGGSFALALRKYTEGVHISAWDRAENVAHAKERGAADEVFSGELKPAIHNADLIYVALPISTTLDVLPEIARHAASHALVTDACSTKVRIVQAAEELFSSLGGPLFLGGHPMAGKELAGIANADANLFRDTTYAFISESSPSIDDEVAPESFSPDDPSVPSPGEPRTATALFSDPRVLAFLKIVEKIGARPRWLGAPQHDYAVGLAICAGDLASFMRRSFLYDHMDEIILPIARAGPGLRDTLRLA